MDDLKARLRSSANIGRGVGSNETSRKIADGLDEAAERIEKLEAENARLQDEVVALWHQAPSEDRSLQECLGMTTAEYVAWVNPLLSQNSGATLSDNGGV